MKLTEIDWKHGEILWLEEDLELSGDVDSQLNILREDLIAVRYKNTLTLDLGWYPEFDSSGQFVLTVVKLDDWENPIWQLKFRDLSQLTLNINKAVNVASGTDHKA